MSNNNSACVRKPRRIAPSYKPTADRLCKSVNQLKKDLTILETQVDDNTEDIQNLQNTHPSVMSFFLDGPNQLIPNSTNVTLTSWTIHEATNEFSSGNYNNGFFTAPSDGIYYVTAHSLWALDNTTTLTQSIRNTFINQNDSSGTLVGQFETFNNPTNNGKKISQTISVPISLSQNDTLSINVYQDDMTPQELFANDIGATNTKKNTTWSIIKY